MLLASVLAPLLVLALFCGDLFLVFLIPNVSSANHAIPALFADDSVEVFDNFLMLRRSKPRSLIMMVARNDGRA